MRPIRATVRLQLAAAVESQAIANLNRLAFVKEKERAMLRGPFTA